MEKYNIYNFDHGFTKGCSINFGKYHLIITDKDCENLKKLEKNSSYTLTMDKNFKRIKEQSEFIKGEILKTAELEINDNDLINDSIVYDSFFKRNSIDDFIVFLSFISGRQVFLKKDINKNSSTNYFNSIVNTMFYCDPLVNIDDGFRKLKEYKLGIQFYNLTYSKTIKDPRQAHYKIA